MEKHSQEFGEIHEDSHWHTDEDLETQGQEWREKMGGLVLNGD